MPMVCTYAYAIVKSAPNENDTGVIEEQEKEPMIQIPEIKL